MTKELSEVAAKFEARCAKLGISITAEFVPFSRSRNAAEKDKSLNWKIYLVRAGFRGTFTADYMQGIGHVPGYKFSTYASVNMARGVYAACETGRVKKNPDADYSPLAPLPSPRLSDVLSCLLMDAEAINAGTFENWAADLGYDLDSRKAEAIYNECVAQGLKLRAMLGDAVIDELRELGREL